MTTKLLPRSGDAFATAAVCAYSRLVITLSSSNVDSHAFFSHPPASDSRATRPTASTYTRADEASDSTPSSAAEKMLQLRAPIAFRRVLLTSL